MQICILFADAGGCYGYDDERKEVDRSKENGQGYIWLRGDESSKTTTKRESV